MREVPFRARPWAFCLALVAGCGALGAPARGDRDLSSSLFGGYASVAQGLSPTGTAVLVAADGDGSLEDPAVLRTSATAPRALYVTLSTSDGMVRVARAQERTAGLLDFGPFTTVLRAELPWEQGGVRAPSLVVDGATVWLAYEAGGAIGVARSTDGGASFERGSEPVLRAEAGHQERGPLASPSIARTDTGGFVLAYASAGALFVATAATPSGPWTRVGAGPVASPQPNGDGGLETLDDPSLVIERTASDRTLTVLAATSRADARGPSTIVGFGSYDGVSFQRAERALYLERNVAVRAGSFDRVDPRTMLLWVSRPDGARRGIGALLTPGGQRAGNPLRP